MCLQLLTSTNGEPKSMQHHSPNVILPINSILKLYENTYYSLNLPSSQQVKAVNMNSTQIVYGLPLFLDRGGLTLFVTM